jgi:uncharacterized membrane-anchored protein
MAIRLLRRTQAHLRPNPGADPGGVIVGKARLDKRTKNLSGRLRPGEIAIIAHDELDRVAAETLVERGVAAVVNTRSSVSERYPNLGPIVLVAAGVPVLDAVGDGVFDLVAEGQEVRLEGERLLAGPDEIAHGVRLTEESVREQMDAAHAKLTSTVEQFAENTLDYVRKEQGILLDAINTPDLRTKIRGRHALVVTRGYHYREDLDTLRTYIREMRPVVIAVDGAADACLERGIKPHIILGDMDSVSTEALAAGAELVVHGYANGEAPGIRTVEALGLTAQVLTAPGTSEDVAMLLAHERGAELIVAVGSHNSVVEFLDKGRAGMASTFLARLRIGPRLVDAKGVSQLYHRLQLPARHLVLLVGGALLTMIIVSFASDSMRLYWEAIWQTMRDVLFQIRSLF